MYYKNHKDKFESMSVQVSSIGYIGVRFSYFEYRFLIKLLVIIFPLIIGL
ncbi:hypothetical protein WBP_0466 [Wolbachia endosymbiont of Brugia pahangi]|nr:hypothetical protein WBP_0466 [Wolbachia endosymbiont of Brugia pahangi]